MPHGIQKSRSAEWQSGNDVRYFQASARTVEKKSNLGNFDLDLLADLCGTADTVDNRLVDDDLRSRDGGFGVIYGSVEEGSHLLLKEVAGSYAEPKDKENTPK